MSRLSASFSLVVSILLHLQITDSAKVLYFVPAMSNSHAMFAQRLGQSITQSSNQSHSIHYWVVQSNLAKDHFSAHHPKERLTFADFVFSKEIVDRMSTQVFEDPPYSTALQLAAGMIDMNINLTRDLLDNYQSDIARLRQEKFDFVIAHCLDATPLMISHLIGVQNVIIDMVGTYIVDGAAMWIGVDRNPSYIPSTISQFDDRMSFTERLKHLLIYAVTDVFTKFSGSLFNKQTAIFREAPDENRPDAMWDLGPSINGIIINGEPFLDYPRPLFHTVQFIGKMNTKGAKIVKDQRLDESIQQLVNDSKYRAFVMVSFGTVAQSDRMPMLMRKAIMSQLGQLEDLRIIWKFDAGLPGVENYENIARVDWLPQKALLKHPRCVGFITHGGYNSLLEGAHAGVPLIMIPLFGDQFGNALRAMRHNLGRIVWKTDLVSDSTELRDVVKEVTTNQRYKYSAQHLAAMINDRIRPSHEILDNRISFMNKEHRKKFYNTRNISDIPMWKYWMLDLLLVWGSFSVIMSVLAVQLSLRIWKLILKLTAA